MFAYETYKRNGHFAALIQKLHRFRQAQLQLQQETHKEQMLLNTQQQQLQQLEQKRLLLSRAVQQTKEQEAILRDGTGRE